MHHNESLIFDLPPTKRRQRIVGIFGKKYNERLVPVDEHTSITSISGFVLKPKYSKRTRGEQFLFINNIHYLNKVHVNTGTFRTRYCGSRTIILMFTTDLTHAITHSPPI